MYSDELLLAWYRRVAARVPGLSLFDAHTHLGSDPDGSHLSAGDLAAALELTGARAVAFPFMDPAGYREANAAVIAAAAASEGRVTAFCRVDPRDDPVSELERCFAAGARGVKLHPRAEGFDLRHPGVRAVMAACEDHNAPVLMHAGLGIPSLGRDALALAEQHPSVPLILAHVDEPDLAWIWREIGAHPSLFVDTAWWNPADHVALFAHVPPGHILLGSDTPYGTTCSAALVAMVTALGAGLSAEQVGAVCGGRLQRLLTGEWSAEALDLGPAPGPPPPRSPLVERVFTLLVGALAQMRTGARSDDLLALARLGCDVSTDDPQAAALAHVKELLELRATYAQSHELDGRRGAGFHLVLVAAALAASPHVLADDPGALVMPDDGGR
ncbi:MAG: amidohydrolase family protein [Thermoleophilia bacterium]